MAKWIATSGSDLINLDNICHIWIDGTPNGFFLCGEMMHNKEEVVLSLPCEKYEECQSMMRDILYS